MWKEVVVAYFKFLFLHFLLEIKFTKKKKKYCQNFWNLGRESNPKHGDTKREY
jgi:hypothetical protein